MYTFLKTSRKIRNIQNLTMLVFVNEILKDCGSFEL